MSEEMAQIYADLNEVKRALFGNALRQEVGIVKSLEALRRATEEIARQQEALLEMVPIIQKLERDNEERRERETEGRQNRWSRQAMEVGRILAVVAAAAPVIATDVRHLWLGQNPLAGPAVMLGAVAAAAVLSILLRRNGG